jgi:hypothetical protein
MTKTLRVLVPAFVLTALATSGCYVTSTPGAVASPRPWPAEYGRVPHRHDEGRGGPYERRPDPAGGYIAGHWEAAGHIRVTGHSE